MDRLRQEEGMALVVALATLLVFLLLAGLVATASSQLSSSVNKDEDAKRAFQAAEGALDTATYRLNASTTFCATASTCTGTVALAEGASGSFSIGPVVTTGVCAGQTVQTGTRQARCVTATGTADGVVRRVQGQLTGAVGTSSSTLFPVPGFLGLSQVDMNNGRVFTKETNGSLTAGFIGSNGQVTIPQPIDNALNIGLGPAAPNPVTGNRNATVTTTRNTTAYSQGTGVIPVGSTATTNLNADTTAWASSNGNTRTYTATGRSISFDNGTFTFKKSGDYNFCSFQVNNTTTFAFSSTSIKVRIFIDSPSRTGSSCPANTGTFKVQNGMSSTGTADQLQVYVLGGDVNGSPAVDFVNSGTNNMFIYAPLATVHFGNSQRFTGGITANIIDFDQAFDFWWDKSVTAPTGTGGSTNATSFGRFAWRECPSTGACL